MGDAEAAGLESIDDGAASFGAGAMAGDPCGLGIRAPVGVVHSAAHAAADRAAQNYDRVLVEGLKALRRLPASAANEFVYSPTDRGGLGFVPMYELHAVFWIGTVLSFLSTDDPSMRNITLAQAPQVVHTVSVSISTSTFGASRRMSSSSGS